MARKSIILNNKELEQDIAENPGMSYEDAIILWGKVHCTRLQYAQLRHRTLNKTHHGALGYKKWLEAYTEIAKDDSNAIEALNKIDGWLANQSNDPAESNKKILKTEKLINSKSKEKLVNGKKILDLPQMYRAVLIDFMADHLRKIIDDPEYRKTVKQKNLYPDLHKLFSYCPAIEIERINNANNVFARVHIREIDKMVDKKFPGRKFSEKSSTGTIGNELKKAMEKYDANYNALVLKYILFYPVDWQDPIYGILSSPPTIQMYRANNNNQYLGAVKRFLTRAIQSDQLVDLYNEAKKASKI